MANGSPGDIPTSEPLRDALAAADALGLLGPVAAGAAVRDESGRIVDFRMIAVNPAGALALGRDASEILGATWSTLWPHLFDAGTFDAFVQIVESREILRVAPATELSTLEPGGDPRALEASIGPLGDGYVIVWRDVTEQFLASQALSHSEGRFRRLLEHAEEGILVIDNVGNTTMMNDACARILGVDAAAVVGRPAFDTLTAAMTEEQRTFLRQRMLDREQGGAHYEIPYRRSDGSPVLLQVSSTPLFREDGSFEASITFVDDVTAQRQAERRYRLLAENSTDVIRICDGEDVITYISPSAESVLGYRPDQLVGRRWHEFLEPDDAADHVVLLREIGERPESFIRQARFRRPDGVVIWLESAVRQVRDPVTGALIELQASSRDVTERVRTLRALEDSEERYRHRAVHDPLTSLPNRDLLFDRLEHALDAGRRAESHVAVLFVDIDNFKFINDSLGHEVGDRLLVEVGNRIASVARVGDTVGRFGGDEYVVVCERVAGESAAVAVAERVAARVRESVEVHGQRLRLTVSIGIAVGGATTKETPDELLRSADLAMYRAKQRGRNRWEIFDTSLSADASRRLHVESELRDALENGQLRVHYQPIIDLRGGALTGVEALVRWQHPSRGLLMPTEFLDIAEETGLIVSIGAQVLHQACADAARWLEMHPARPMTVAVNVSLRQLAWGDFTAVIDQALAESGIDPRLLHLELTETALFDATRTSPTDLSAIDRLGVAIGIDDFGTGYSSLAYLKRFPVRFLKIDKTFIDGLGTDPEDTAIVEAIINLGHTLGLDVIAEGVETGVQLEALRGLNCTAAQGYLLARPQSFEDLTPVLLGRTGPPPVGAENDERYWS